MPRHPSPRAAAVAALVALVLVGCETEDDPVSPDPEDLEEPADDAGGVDAPLDEEPEPGTGEPAVEGEGEGRLSPEENEADDPDGD